MSPVTPKTTETSKELKIRARLGNLRIASRKVRLVADLIRGKKVAAAQTILQFATKKAALPLLKLLNSAAANAKNNFQVEPAELYISEILVNEGAKLKRFRARARGSAYEIQKKVSHVELVLTAGEGKVKKIRKTKKAAEAQPKEEPKIEKERKPEEKPKFKVEKEVLKPRADQGVRRIFRRKAF